MSLSTQLARGPFALTLLLAFVTLSAFAEPPASPAKNLLLAASPTVAYVLNPASPGCSRAPALRLALAPADLSQLSSRWTRSCRA
jgi:hypothetical protein